jgi:ankyrin repeat protein
MAHDHEGHLVAPKHTAVAHFLLEKDAHHSARDKFGWTPLMLAAINGFADMVHELGRPDGAHAVDVNEEDGARWHALHYAAQYGHAAAARTLLDLGADVDARDDINWTPMMRACEGKHLDVAMLLLERGADPEARNRSHNKSVKQICAERGLHPVVDRIEGRDREL